MKVRNDSFAFVVLALGLMVEMTEGCDKHHHAGGLRNRQLKEHEDAHLLYDPARDSHHSRLHDGNPTDGGWCGSPKATPEEKLESKKAVDEYVENNGRKLSSFSVVVPTYWFVIHKTDGTGYLSSTHISDSMDVLNAAFEGQGFSFQLMDTQYYVNNDWFDNDDHDTFMPAIRPDTATAGDLLIYSATAGDEYLGYAYLPSAWSNTFDKDGVVLDYESVPGFYSWYEGDILTHEVGHWLGLYHTFNEDSCSQTYEDLDYETIIEGDGVDDTPVQYSPTSGCPIGRDSCPNNPGVDPIHNFMDYSDDYCKYEFTAGQFLRMKVAWNLYRAPYHTPPTTSGPVTRTTNEFSEESRSNQGNCPFTNGLQTTLSGLRCAGDNCDNLQMTCYNSGTLRVKNAIRTSIWFSEENGGLGECPGTNQVITQVQCRGDYCDDLRLFCQELSEVSLDYNNCFETAVFPSTLNREGYGEIPDDSYAVGICCSHSWCGKKSIRYCYEGGSGGSGEVTVTTDEFSEENDGSGVCPISSGLQTILSGLRCAGDNCDNLQMTCYNSGTLQVKNAIRTSLWFSEENGGLGECPGTNQVITQVQCRGDYCDDLKLFCQELSEVSVDYNNCFETAAFPSTLNREGYGEIPDNSYAVGIRCSHSWCGKKSIRYCYESGSSGGGGVTATSKEFSEENNGRGECPVKNGLQTTLSSLRCMGDFCDNLQMTCYNSGSVQLESAIWSSEWFSEERGGFGYCPYRDTVITQMQCRGDYCDDLKLFCQELSSVSLDYNNCFQTSPFPSTLNREGYGEIPKSAYSIGIQCSDSWCGKKSIIYCYSS